MSNRISMAKGGGGEWGEGKRMARSESEREREDLLHGSGGLTPLVFVRLSVQQQSDNILHYSVSCNVTA